MRKFLLLLLVVSFAGAFTARAQDLLPDTFGGWKASAPSQRYAPFQLAQLSPTDAAILQEYGVQSAEQRTLCARRAKRHRDALSPSRPERRLRPLHFLPQRRADARRSRLIRLRLARSRAGRRGQFS